MTFTSTAKTLISAALIAGAASAATAGGANAIFQGDAQNIDTLLNLDLVRSSANGTVEIYDFHKGERGALLGSTDVHAGANTDVKVRISPTAANEVLAVLSVNGAEVAFEDIDDRD